MEHLIKIYGYEGNKVSFEKKADHVMVNANEMAKPFGKQQRVFDFLRTDITKDYMESLSDTLKTASADLVKVTKGGDPKIQGTWMHEDLAFEFARWLNPKFGIWCNLMIKKLLVDGSVDLFKAGEPLMVGKKEFYVYNAVLSGLGIEYSQQSLAARIGNNRSEFILYFGVWYVSRAYAEYIQGLKKIERTRKVFSKANRTLAVAGMTMNLMFPEIV